MVAFIYFENTDGKNVTGKQNFGRRAAGFLYTKLIPVYIVGTIKTHGSSHYRWRTTCTSSTLEMLAAGSTQCASLGTGPVEDPSINIAKHYLCFFLFFSFVVVVVPSMIYLFMGEMGEKIFIYGEKPWGPRIWI